MTTRSPEHPTHRTGAHRAHPRASRTTPKRPPDRYEPYLDGLFTYCLSVLCDHDAATTALGDVLALAERRGTRAPAADTDRRAWLYALARWACLRRLAEARRKRQATHSRGRTPAAGKADESSGARTGESGGPAGRAASWAAAAEPAGAADRAAAAADQERRRQLALLAWPEAAGTTPEQREALELAVRHGLAPREVAAVLGMEPATARELLSAAACEVERTRAALAVVEKGTCPSVARLTGDRQLLLGTALRAELVRHVDDCPRCRRTAERAGAAAWPGTSASAAALPVIGAPRAAARAAMGRAAHARGGAPRFDRRGFPMDPKDRAARRDRLRARAVTTTVVATVVAAPVLALWAAYRGAPLVGEGRDGSSVSASETDGTGLDDDARDYENAGNARTDPDPRFTAGSRSPDVSVEVISSSGEPSDSRVGPGRLTVSATPSGGVTVVTLTASGGEPVHWSAATRAYWLHLSRSSGTLQPGESVSFRVYVDHGREPAGHWSARISVGPGDSVVAIDGYGASGPSPSDPGHTSPPPSPSDPPPSSPGPDPTPTETSPSPSDPPPSSPDPDPTDSSPPPSEPEPSDPPSSGPGEPSSTGG